MWSFVYNNLMQLFPELDESYFTEEETNNVSVNTQPEEKLETAVKQSSDAAFSEALKAAEALELNITSVLSDKLAQKLPAPTKNPKQTYRINDTDLSRAELIKFIESLERQMVYNYKFVDNVIDKINLKLLTEQPKRKDLDLQTILNDSEKKRQRQKNERKLELLREELKRQMLKTHKNV